MNQTESADLLIVEDNPHDLELTLRALTKCAIQKKVLVVRDGAEALDYLFCRNTYAERPTKSPKAIFLDMKLPRVDGKQVLRRLKENAQTRCIPVVMLTSSQQERDIEESYDLGVNSYIVKPVDFTEFSDAIAQCGTYWLAMNLPLP